MTWLVTGGAGYIGAHVVARMHRAGHRVVVLDDLSTGLADRVPRGVRLVVASVCDQLAVTEALRSHEITGVLHLAGRKSVPESVVDPVLYFRENVGGITVLLGAVRQAGVHRIIFSSSAAVYGVPATPLVTERSATEPVNPYGQSKLACEHLLRASGIAYGLSWIALRYFNVVGADDVRPTDRGMGNLFPVVFRAVEEGHPVTVTGGDYPTRDGSGVRDYVHVADVADAHVAAVNHLTRTRAAEALNVGTGRGHSVLEVIRAVAEVSGRDVPHLICARRPGDAAEVVAGVDRIRTVFGWRAQHDFVELVRRGWQSWRVGEPVLDR